MPVFDNADADYVRWLETHPGGYVLNTYRKPHPDYLILHRATCKSISRTASAPIAWTSGDYIKICADSLGDLEAWSRVAVDGKPQPCGQCHPYGRS
ncbi:MAG: hypothetical protein U0075_18215 [Thermomicrobiales bacterium]